MKSMPLGVFVTMLVLFVMTLWVFIATDWPAAFLSELGHVIREFGRGRGGR